jgi:hypothetical protein
VNPDAPLGKPVTEPNTTYRLSNSIGSKSWALAEDGGPTVAHVHAITADDPDDVENKVDAWLREHGEEPVFWGRTSGAPPTLYVQTRKVNP